ncbi:hypothetical protein MKW92_046651 [Papaver armeniacum]|nr:hypothetical protein MKW92_046651 [Papaver armeniacum]
MEAREIIHMKEEEEDEEEEQICRICHGPGDSENPLKYPCACSGSIKFVHSKCLLLWKKRITFDSECEVCKHKYSVRRVYAENTPTRLPLREFVSGIPVKACHVVLFCLRICVSVLNQLLVLPFISFWMWRLCLRENLSEAKELLVHGFMSPSSFMMMEWLYALLIGIIILLFVTWMCGFVEDWAIPPQPGNRNHNADEIGEDARVEQQAIASVRNADVVELWFTVLVALLQYFLGLVASICRLAVHDPVRRTCRYLAMCITYFPLNRDVLQLVRFLLGRIILPGLTWLFFAASSIFMPFINSALYIENNSLKNDASHAIQNDGLLSCAIEVVAETLTANSIGAGEELSSVGKPLLVYRSSGLYDVITLATGYMLTVPLVFVCLKIPIRTLLPKIQYCLRKFLTTLVNLFFLIIHLGVLPSVYGWWLDVCTITMLGSSISDRVEFFAKFPLLSSFMHWTIGIMYVFEIHISTSHAQRVLHNDIQYFFHDLTDPVCIISRVLTNDVQLQASKLPFLIAVNGILIVVSGPFTEIPVVMLLLQIFLPYAIELRKTVEALLRQWVTAVCCVLGLSGFLCSRPEYIGGQEDVKVERQQDRLHDGLIAAQDPNKSICNSTFVLRVVLFVFLAWIMLLLWIMWLLFSSSLIIVSLPLGRVLLSSISNLPITHGIKCNDLYALFVGSVSIWTSFTGARYFIEHFKAGKAHFRFSDICKWCSTIVENRVLLSLWTIAIPLLIGLLFEFLLMEPIRAVVVESPVFLLCQDWAVGFFFFKLWRTLVVLDHRIVLVDESWRIKIDRVRDNDLLKLPRRWMLQEILIPIVMNLLISLCPPYVIARWVVPSLGVPLTGNSTVFRFTWVAYATIIACAKRFPVWVTKLHNSIRADRYSGFALQNVGEAAMECRN